MSRLLFEARAAVLACEAQQALIEKEIELEKLKQQRKPLTDEQRPQSAPPGYKLVPINPTEEMLEAVRQKPHPTRPDGWDDRHTKIYQAMIFAAPGEQK